MQQSSHVCVMQAQQATDAVSDQRQQLQDSQEALTTSQLQLAEASSSQQQLQSHFIELQLQAAESAAQHSNLQIALKASEDKLAASETELGESQAQVSALQSLCQLTVDIKSPDALHVCQRLQPICLVPQQPKLLRDSI